MIVLFAVGVLCVVGQTHFGTTRRRNLTNCRKKNLWHCGFSFRPFFVCNGSACVAVTCGLRKLTQHF